METLIKPSVKNLTNKKLTNKKVNVKKQPKERILGHAKGLLVSKDCWEDDFNN